MSINCASQYGDPPRFIGIHDGEEGYRKWKAGREGMTAEPPAEVAAAAPVEAAAPGPAPWAPAEGDDGGNKKWVYVDGSSFYFTGADIIPHEWKSKPVPVEGAKIRSLQVYKGYVYAIDDAAGNHWRTPAHGQGDWHQLGGDGCKLITIGDDMLWAFCDGDSIYGSPCGPDVNENTWTSLALPDGGGLKSFDIFDKQLFVITGNGNYHRTDVAGGGEWKQLAGDGGAVLATGAGKLWAQVVDAEGNLADSMYVAPIGQDVEDLAWAAAGPGGRPGGVTSMSIYNDKLHTVDKNGGKYCQTAADNSGAEWEDCGGDGGLYLAVGAGTPTS